MCAFLEVMRVDKIKKRVERKRASLDLINSADIPPPMRKGKNKTEFFLSPNWLFIHQYKTKIIY